MKKSLRFLTLCLCISVLAPIAHMASGDDINRTAAIERVEQQFATAMVQSIDGLTEDDDYGFQRVMQHVTMRITSGAEKGKIFPYQNGILNGRDDMKLTVGEKVIVTKNIKSDGSSLYLIQEKYRLPSVVWLTILFVVITIVFGGITGITSLLGLVASILVMVIYVIPQIISGGSPLQICLVGAALIACTSLYLAHGFNKRTSVALLSTIITLAASALMAIFYVYVAKLFGMGSEESVYMQSGALQNVDLRGLLLGGIIIGCLGVLDDVTTAQCATIDEISKANPSLTSLQLRKAGFSVGKEHIASLINTLALAYAGASLPLLLLFKTQASYPLWVTLNSEFLSEEIVRTLVGSATLVLAVPISTFFASRLLKADRHAKPIVSTGAHHHGHSH